MNVITNRGEIRKIIAETVGLGSQTSQEVADDIMKALARAGYALTAPTYRDDVIEECAKRAQEILDDAAGEREPFNPKCIPAHIRALKDSPHG